MQERFSNMHSPLYSNDLISITSLDLKHWVMAMQSELLFCKISFVHYITNQYMFSYQNIFLSFSLSPCAVCFLILLFCLSERLLIEFLVYLRVKSCFPAKLQFPGLMPVWSSPAFPHPPPSWWISDVSKAGPDLEQRRVSVCLTKSLNWAQDHTDYRCPYDGWTCGG